MDEFILNNGIMIVLLFTDSTSWHNYCLAQMCLMIVTVSEVSDVAHGPLFDIE